MVRMLDRAQLRVRGISFSRQHIGLLMKRGTFPRAVKAAGGKNYWLEGQIDAYLADRSAVDVSRDRPSADVTADGARGAARVFVIA